MQVGLFVFETAYSLDTAVLAKHAEDVGFESFWVPEHPVIPGQTTSPYRGSADGVLPDAYKRIVDPFIALVWASAVTTTIKLGTGICLVPDSNSRSWFVNLLYDHSSGQWEGHAILSAVFGSNFCHFTSQVVLGKASPSRHGGVACPLWESIWGVGSQSSQNARDLRKNPTQ